MRTLNPLVSVFVAPTLLILSLIGSFYDVSSISGLLKAAILLVSWVVAVIVNYRLTYKPYMSLSKTQQRVMGKIVLENLAHKYNELCAPCEVGISVMVAGWPFWRQVDGKRVWGRNLTTIITQGDFSVTEVSAVMVSGEWVPGKALAENRTLWFDRSLRQDHLFPVSPTNEELTKRVISMLSVPIYRESDKNKVRPIGVLNIQCEAPVESSRFDDSTIQSLAMWSSGALGVFIG